jgi:general secretion pathway protein N
MTRARRLTRDSRTGRRRVLPWAVGGAVVGALLAAVAAAPARWLADAVADASGQRLLLADARGSVWSGSAVAVLTGGPGSRDASALPGRLKWTWAWRARTARAWNCACATPAASTTRCGCAWSPGGPAEAVAAGRPRGARPLAGGLAGGAGRALQHAAPGRHAAAVADGLAVETVQGRWRVSGLAELDLQRCRRA